MLEMRELVSRINELAKAYYEDDAPKISDAEFDLMYDRLKALEKELGVVLDDSPTKRVGGAPKQGFAQSKHMIKLLSLDKSQSKEEFYAWRDKLQKELGYIPELTAEYKFDGLTLNLLYSNGKLQKVTTRGNGEVGEIVTEQVKTVQNLPMQIDYTGTIEIQGEGMLRLSNLENYNKTAVEPLKNARNGAAGAIRNLNPEITRQRQISFFAYNIGYSDLHFDCQSDVREFLKNNGFEIEGEFALITSDADAEQFIDKVDAVRDSLDFLIDGIVFKVNQMSLRDELGSTVKFPKWAIAYKFKAVETTTVLRDVVWQVSRSGKVNPLALLDPVDIGGVTVSRATLNNIYDIQKKGVKIGDEIYLRRSNDVIPEIMGVASTTSDSLPIIAPEFCPACGEKTELKGAFLYCNNADCAPIIISKLSHFASKDAMDIDGFSEKTAETLFNEKGVKTFSDLLSLSASDFAGLDGFKDKKTNNLTQSIAKSRHTTTDRFLYALGIDGIGKKSAKDLVKTFKTFENIMSANFDELQIVDGVGDVLARNILSYFENAENQAEINKLLSLVTFDEVEEKTGVFTGLKVVLTGSLEKFKRSQASQIIEDMGGEVMSSVSKTVNLVVVGADAGSKKEKALKLGIKCITEDEFESMINQS